jgi:hypothetical protein
MKRKTRTRLATCLVIAAPVAIVTGCVPYDLCSHGASFSLGWLLREWTMPTTTETQCYHNGVLTDCSELPSELIKETGSG